MPKIAAYYDLDPQISNKNILTRCADETKKNNLYLTTEEVREVVEANKERVKIINTGVKAFARYVPPECEQKVSLTDRCENKGATCDFRLAQEGVLSTVPFIGPSRCLRRILLAPILLPLDGALFIVRLFFADDYIPPWKILNCSSPQTTQTNHQR